MARLEKLTGSTSPDKDLVLLQVDQRAILHRAVSIMARALREFAAPIHPKSPPSP
ncbi:MAG: hypothetical protein KBA71_00995 [Opitutaceae bacterium]|nr:hypothetical protein [Opitutaceae bacterium]